MWTASCFYFSIPRTKFSGEAVLTSSTCPCSGYESNNSLIRLHFQMTSGSLSCYCLPWNTCRLSSGIVMSVAWYCSDLTQREVGWGYSLIAHAWNSIVILYMDNSSIGRKLFKSRATLLMILAVELGLFITFTNRSVSYMFIHPFGL